MKKIVLLAFVLVLLSTAVVWGFMRLTVGHANESNGSYGDGGFVFASSNTIWVPDNFTSIQEAINNASDGDTIFVRADTYYEQLVVNKTVSLVGENRSTTIIDGEGAGIVIRSNAPDVEIRGFTVQNGGGLDNSGILLGNCIRNKVCDNIIRNNALAHGITLGMSNGCSIIGNKIMNNDWAGIRVLNSSNNTIYENTIINNSWGVWIPTSSSLNNTFYHNNFIDNNPTQVESIAFTTNWDNGTEGNFWSDYTGEDLDSDGIGNTLLPHFYDYYPLMKSFGDIAPPMADAGPDQEVFQGMTVTFNGSGSTDDVGIKSYVWNFTDVTPKNLTGVQPQYTFNNTGYFEVTLNVTDYAGKRDTDTVLIHVVPEFPTWSSMLLILVVLTVAIAVYKRKLLKTKISFASSSM